MGESTQDDRKESTDTEELNAEKDYVAAAVSRRDWEELRKLSLRPGGFGEDRRDVWSFLLHARKVHDKFNLDEGPDEGTGLRRRKVPLSETDAKLEGDEMRVASEQVFTGDIEKKSHPDEHQIKLDTDRSFVLYSVDDDMMSREEMQARLNALIISVFRRRPRLSYFQGYHDIITVILLTVAPEETLACAEKLSLHRLRDAMGEGLEPLLGLLHIMKYLLRLVDPGYAVLLERNSPLPYFALSNLLTLFSHDVPTIPLIQHVFDYLFCRPPISVVYLAIAVTLSRKDEALIMEEEGEEGMLHSLLTTLPPLSDGDDGEVGRGSEDQSTESRILPAGEARSNEDAEEQEQGLPRIEVKSEDSASISLSKEEPDNHPGIENVSEDGVEGSGPLDGDHDHLRKVSGNSQQSDMSLPGSSVLSNLSSSDLKSSSESLHRPEDFSDSVPRRPDSLTPSRASSSSSSSITRKQPTIFLPDLLSHADLLYTQYPPSLPSLHIKDILGPQSVVHTWSEIPEDLPADDEAEAMAHRTDLIVRPWFDPDEAAQEEANISAKEHESKKRRKLHRTRRFPKVQLDKKTVLTGAVVTLAVAVAIYSYSGTPRSSRGSVYASLHRLSHWERLHGAVTKVAGGAQRVLAGLGWSAGF